jgi:hypothetical protein
MSRRYLEGVERLANVQALKILGTSQKDLKLGVGESQPVGVVYNDLSSIVARVRQQLHDAGG